MSFVKNVRMTRLAVVQAMRPAAILTEYESCRVEPNGVNEIRPQATAASVRGATSSAVAATRLAASGRSRIGHL
jgi:hypothetical protein